jgi:hypothetical protein
MEITNSSNHQDKRKLEYSRLNEIINNKTIDIGHVDNIKDIFVIMATLECSIDFINKILMTNISNIVYKYLYNSLKKVKFTCNINSTWNFNTRKNIDLITGLIVMPNQEIDCIISGYRRFTAKSDENGEINFIHPILQLSLCYNEIDFKYKDNKSCRLILKCITVFGKEQKELFVSSKNILWKLHSSQNERFCYYRGVYLDEFARGLFY